MSKVLFICQQNNTEVPSLGKRFAFGEKLESSLKLSHNLKLKTEKRTVGMTKFIFIKIIHEHGLTKQTVQDFQVSFLSSLLPHPPQKQ